MSVKQRILRMPYTIRRILCFPNSQNLHKNPPLHRPYNKAALHYFDRIGFLYESRKQPTKMHTAPPTEPKSALFLLRVTSARYLSGGTSRPQRRHQQRARELPGSPARLFYSDGHSVFCFCVSLTRQPARKICCCSASSGPVVKLSVCCVPSGRISTASNGCCPPSFSRTPGNKI